MFSFFLSKIEFLCYNSNMNNGWNLWHGCTKYSEGCANCYVYRQDSRFEKDAQTVYQTKAFYWPIEKDKKGNYKLKAGSIVPTCFTSDFLLEECDKWRDEAWQMIKERSDCTFLFITKRIVRLKKCLPEDWGNGYDNVIIGVTCENQKRADERLPLFNSLPIKHKIIICEPLLEEIDLTNHLNSSIEEVIVGGESGENARLCDFAWVMKLRQNCIEKNIPFTFKQTGARFIKDGKLYLIKRQFQHSQAKKANINTTKS